MPTHVSSRYQVADLIVDVDQRQVSRDGEDLQLTGLTFDFLRVLVESASKIVSHDELADKVWSGRAVTPETTTQRAMLLRQALGDSAEHPRYFEVVRGHGFRLIPEVVTEGIVPPVSDRGRRYGIPVLLALIVVFLALDKFLPANGFDDAMSQTDSSPRISDQISSGGVRRFTIDIGMTRPKGGALLDADIAITPDGKQLVFSAQRDDEPHLYLRDLDQLETNPIPGADFGQVPFISPDGGWIGYVGVGGLFKIPLRGGVAELVTEQQLAGAGGVWLADGSVIIPFQSGQEVQLRRFGPEPNASEFLRMSDPDLSMVYTQPRVLPGGKHLLVTRSPQESARDGHTILLSLETGETKVLIQGGFNARYVPTGHIVFMRYNDLWAIPFDLESKQSIGPEVLVVEDIQVGGDRGQAVYDFTDGGLLIYLPGIDRQEVDQQDNRIPVWVDRDGNETQLDVDPGNYRLPRLSPDDSRLAIDIARPGFGSDTWIYDFDRGVSTKLTFGSSWDEGAIWSLDGDRLIYSSYSDGRGIYIRNADGTGQRELLVTVQSAWPESLSPDGKDLHYSESFQGGGPTATWDGRTVSMDGGENSQDFLKTRFSESHFQVSPNGNWVAYTSNETGRREIFVRPYPDLDSGKWQVSTNGGAGPRWRADGRELFYISTDVVMSVSVGVGEEFKSESPIRLFTGDYYSPGAPGDHAYRHWDVTNDGEKFLMIKYLDEQAPESAAEQTSLVAVENWFEELKRLAPPNN